jgi:hypothetical protein
MDEKIENQNIQDQDFEPNQFEKLHQLKLGGFLVILCAVTDAEFIAS